MSNHNMQQVNAFKKHQNKLSEPSSCLIVNPSLVEDKSICYY